MALVCCTLLGLAGGAYWTIRQIGQPGSHQVHTSVTPTEIPLVIRTPGGLLEVATVRATERFSRRDTKSFWGIDLGETVTEIQLQAIYRFHMPMAQRWPVQLRDGVAEVNAPAFQPSRPVAFDTASMQLWGRNGWARFNKEESLQILQRSLTQQLGERAQSPHYRELATEAARRTVAEYVRTWLIHHGQSVQEVRVRFPGEARASAPGTAKPPAP